YPDGKKLNMADRNSIVPWADRSVDDGYGFVSPVGAYDPNGYKLYDMVGNVWQLCSDYFDPKFYKKNAGLIVTDPSGPKTGKTNVVRGGSWAFDACEARNAFRFGIDPKLCADMTGFRVVTMPDAQDRNVTPVSPDVKIDAPLIDEQVNAIFNQVRELVSNGKRLQARKLVDKIPKVHKGCLEDESGFVKNVLKSFIDQTSNKSLESFTNLLGMRMIRIPEGSFVMGSSEADIAWAMTVLARGQPLSLENEYPFHKVRISRPFFMAATPVTVQQFQTFVDDTGYVTDAEEDNGGEVFDTKNNRFVRKSGSSWRNPGWRIEPDQPVAMITYNDAVAFCEWLSAVEKAPYKLPTEAQWEYAARGTLPMAQFPWGDQPPDGRRANYADKNKDFEWRDRDVDGGFRYVSPVGSFPPNGFGLYDMAGNVQEWVRDYYQEDYYRYAPEIDPEGPGQGENRVTKGGDWTSSPVSLRCAFRGWARPDLALYNAGFRVIMDTNSSQRPFHFSENFLTQRWVPNPEQREVAQAIAKENERSLKRQAEKEAVKTAHPQNSVTRGVLIIEFTPKSDARKQGMAKGDIIIEYDGVTDLDSDKLIALTAQTKKERRRAIIKFVRDGYEYSLQVPPGSLGISITDTVLRAPFKHNNYEQDLNPKDDPNRKKKQWT
ncbi:MAG: SUMF1/EgtB/PvdO family nonheme iron enzyme, partial [Desulfomonilaceae bacterium]